MIINVKVTEMTDLLIIKRKPFPFSLRDEMLSQIHFRKFTFFTKLWKWSKSIYQTHFFTKLWKWSEKIESFFSPVSLLHFNNFVKKLIWFNLSQRLIMTSKCSLQLFLYRMNGINHDNSYPLIYFKTPTKKYEFIKGLKSVPRERTESPHFVVNNPQLLPHDIRILHMHENTYRIDGLDSPQQGDDLVDGIYLLEENINLLRNCSIDNNTVEETGLVEYLLEN